MGGAIPKQYLDLNGVPVLVRALQAFQRHPFISAIVLTVPPGDEEYCRTRMVAPHDIDKVIHVVGGGSTRQESVYNGLIVLEEMEIVAIHDAARPLVSAKTISATIEAARSSGAALACVPVRETVKRKSGAFLETVSRADLWLAHTPQTFRTELILEAHRLARESGFDGTDDSALVERLGHPVTIVPDSENNLKITTPEDLNRAGMLLRHMGVGAPDTT